GPRVGLVAPDHKRAPPPRSMRSDPEPEPASPRLADEVRALDAELVEHCDGIRNPARHLISVRLVRLLALAKPAVIDICEPELGVRKRLRQGRFTEVGDRIEQTSVEDNRRALATVILEEGPYQIR